MSFTGFLAWIAAVNIAGILILAVLPADLYAYLLIQILLAFIVCLFFRQEKKKQGFVFLLFLLGAFLLWTVPVPLERQMLLSEVQLAAVFIWLRKAGLSPAAFCRIRKFMPGKLPFLVLEAALLLVAAGYFGAWSRLFFKNNVALTLKMASGYFPAACIIICLLPAVMEELIFRGCILRSMENVNTGIWISAILFTVWHLNPGQMVYAFPAGLLLALMAVRTDDLLCTIMTHFLFNFYNLLQAAVPAGSWAEKAISSIRVGSYRLFVPKIVNENGKIALSQALWGFACMAAATLAYMAILMFISGPEDEI